MSRTEARQRISLREFERDMRDVWYDPRLAQWVTGFLGVRIQNRIGVYPSFAFGEVRSAGRWWWPA